MIPTFQRVEATVKAVSSVLAQTRPADQIIVVDDGSGAAAVQSLAMQLPADRVTVLESEHTAHPGRARNRGIAELRTTHVAFLDSDDQWHPRKLEMQMALAESGRAAICTPCSTDPDVLSQEVRPVALQAVTVGLADLMDGNTICNSSVLIDRRLLEAAGGIPASYAVRGIEDFAAWLRVAYLAEWVKMETPLVYYRDDPGASIRSSKECEIPERILAQLDFAAWLRSTGRPAPRALVAVDWWFPRLMRRWARRRRSTESW